MTKESKKQTKQPSAAEVRQRTYDFQGIHIRFDASLGMWQLTVDGDPLAPHVSEWGRAIYSPSLVRIGHAALHLIASDALEVMLGPELYHTVSMAIPSDLKADGFIADGLDTDTLKAEYEQRLAME